VKRWSWHIPELYVAYITELGLEDHPLYEDFRKMQRTEKGMVPQAFEIYPDVFLWRNHGHRIIYERVVEKQILLLVSIERI
jgi:hypothetical protein